MTAARGIAGGAIYQRGARKKSRYNHYYHLISQCIIVLWTFCVWGVNLIPDIFCKSRSCRRILSRLRADLRENPAKQWTSRDALIQSSESISNCARYHNDANIAVGPILNMYIPGKYAFSPPSIVTAILQVMSHQVVIIYNIYFSGAVRYITSACFVVFYRTVMTQWQIHKLAWHVIKKIPLWLSTSPSTMFCFRNLHHPCIHCPKDSLARYENTHGINGS